MDTFVKNKIEERNLQEFLDKFKSDDHSENSKGSASTSGCSSLVSSHKESNRLGQHSYGSLLDVKSSRKRKDASPNSEYNDFNSSRGLWSSSFHSSPSLTFQRRYPTVSHSNQPNFNLSSFVGPSRLNKSSEKKTSSPFYEGKTTFGGASAFRRMPASVVDRSLRNQIKVRDQTSDDNLKRMSSVAERILLTLDKISSPVSDAKRIPNLQTSPVDLSVYLTPPKSRWNSQLTPSIASRGPPIANINTIAKLATLKNYGARRLRSTPQECPVTSVEHKAPSFDILQPNTTEIISQKSGGGKMKNKLLNQHHISSKQGMTEYEVVDSPALKSIPLPITSLPIINFGSKPDKTATTNLSASGFTFSKPIEHDLSVSNTIPTSTLAVHSSYDSFKFAHPIDYDLPNNTQPKENLPNPAWECSACWVRNPQSKTSCLACETPKEVKESKNKVINSTSSTFPTWECPICWVRNPMKEKKCMACETLHPNSDASSGLAFKGLEKPQTTSTVSSASSSAPTNLNAGISTQVPSFQPPVFGASKTEVPPVISAPPVTFTFGTGLAFKGLEKPQTTSTVSSASSSAPTNLNAGISTQVPSFEPPVFGASKTEAPPVISAPPVTFTFGTGLAFKGLEKPQTTSTVSSASSSAPTNLNAGISTQVPSFEPPVFGALKTEAPPVISAPPVTFTFGTGLAFKGLEKPQTTSTVSSASSSAPTNLNAGISTQVPSFQPPVFGASKTEAPPVISAPPVTFTFGTGLAFKGLEKPQTTSTVSSASSSAPTNLNAGISTQVPSFQPPVFGASKTEAPPVISAPPVTFTFGTGFAFKGLEKPQTSSTVSSALSSAPTNLNAGISTQVPSFQPPVFGASKTEAPPVMSAPPVTFTFGTVGATTVSSNTSAFQTPHTGNPSFQFGSQIPGSTASTIGPSVFSKSDAPNPTPSSVSQNANSVFGTTTSNFVFGAKNEKPSLPFGSSTMPVFGNTPVQPSFDGRDKPAATGGFNFGTSSTVFQFGAGSNNTDKKRTATASGFSFGTPSASETNVSSFPTGFSMNTPPSFNFAAASTPTAPFQFNASSPAAAKPAPAANSGARKIRKAVRRVRKD